MNQLAGVDDPDCYLMTTINGYFYVGMKMTFKVLWQMFFQNVLAMKKIFGSAKDRWEVAGEKYQAMVRNWQEREVTTLTGQELLAGVREIFELTAEYYTVIQSGTIGISSTSEILFGKFYDSLVKRKGEAAAPAFLFGSENKALRAEKSLFDIASWIKENPAVLEAMLKETAEQACQHLAEPDDGTRWDEFRDRFKTHLAEYGHSIYDLDFAKPVPADDPLTAVQTMRAYLDGTAANPYERQQAALERRENLTRNVTGRLDPLRRKWFLKALKWAQETAHLREDSIADIGLGYPQIRKMLGELGKRLAGSGAIAQADDVYWLEAREVDALAATLDQGGGPVNHAEAIEARKSKWQAMRKISPPGVIPKNSFLSKLMPHEDQPGDTLKGIGGSAGKISARACVMRGPEDFSRMQPGDVIVAVTTTPAWTPLFARAAAVVTDIGGPLSHSSIVAREYGIPAVMGTGVATRRIQNGQVICVDGSAGTVTLKG